MFYYVYILQSVNNPEHFYTGFTENLKQRLSEHNEGKSQHTEKFKPWKIKTAIAFIDKKRALDFEKYLKTS
jgi:putative endonuclease